MVIFPWNNYNKVEAAKNPVSIETADSITHYNSK